MKRKVPGVDPRVSAFGHHRRECRIDDLVVTLTHHSADLRTPSHAHPWACLHYVLDGCYSERTAAEALRVPRGELLFKPPEQDHWNEQGCGAWTLRVEVPPTGGERDALLPVRSRSLRDPRAALLAERLAMTLLRDADEVDDVGEVEVAADREALTLELLAMAGCSGAPPGDGRGRATALAGRCVELIEESRDRPLGLAAAARRLGVHRAHLARVFRSEIGMTMGAYQRALRLRRVLTRMREGDDASLAEVACDHGFADQSHLTRAMRESVGMTPARARSLWS